MNQDDAYLKGLLDARAQWQKERELLLSVLDALVRSAQKKEVRP